MRGVLTLPDVDITLWWQPLTHREAAALVWHGWLRDLGEDPSRLTRSAQGKPTLPDRPLAFNLAHTLPHARAGRPGWLVMAWSRTQPRLGVDVEQCGRQQAIDRLAARYLHPLEQARWAETPDEATWLRLWTRKEAVVKAHGLGLRLRLNGLDTTGDRVAHPNLGRWQVRTHAVHDALVSVAWPDTL